MALEKDGRIVLNELKTHPLLRIADLEALKEWLRKQPHLPTVPDEQLVLFLNSCDFSLERAKRTIDSYYSIRTHAPEFLGDRDPKSSSVQAALNVINLAIIPTPDKDGNRYVFQRLRDTNPQHFAYCPLLKLHIMATDLSQKLHGAEPGYVFVFDVHGSTAEHAARLQLSTLRKYFVYLQEAMPLKMKAIHMINCIPLVEKVMQWVKPFINNDIIDVLHMHSGPIEDLQNHIPRKLLPKDYGGDQDTLENLHEHLKQQLYEHRTWFLEDQQLKADESKRQGKQRTEGDLFGMEGSFKQLDID